MPRIVPYRRSRAHAGRRMAEAVCLRRAAVSTARRSDAALERNLVQPQQVGSGASPHGGPNRRTGAERAGDSRSRNGR